MLLVFPGRQWRRLLGTIPLLFLVSCGRVLGSASAPTGNGPPVLTSYEDTPAYVLAGKPVRFALHWSDARDAVRAVICKTKLVVDGACSGGTWASGDFSSSNPALAQYQTPEGTSDAFKYFPFVCDASGACSDPIHTSPTECAYFDVDVEPGDPADVCLLACDQSPATGDETTEPPPAAPTPVSGITGAPKAGGFETEIWGEEATNLPGRLSVVASTARGTYALTGGVIDWDTAEAIVGALIVFEAADGDLAVSTRTDDDGAFAFIDVPVTRGERVILTARARGYKDLRVIQEASPGTYVVSWELQPSG